jgi:hypothetical protein
MPDTGEMSDIIRQLEELLNFARIQQYQNKN